MNPAEIKFIGAKRWQVVRLLGQGGMSWVFEVIDPRLGVPRALKMLKPAAASSAGYKSFWREAEILARQEDDFLVRIYDLDNDPETGNDYYVMELLSGSDLKQHLKAHGPLDPENAKAVFASVLQALAKLHGHSPPIIHRDIKPGNIQITASGRPKLLDLGIAKVTRRSADETVFGDDSTVADMFKGTVLYASPEHLAMQEPGPQSDVFAMGLCLYEAIEGRHAYARVEGLPDPTSSHVLYQDVFRFYTRLEAKGGKLQVAFERTPKDLQAVIRRALELDPRRRFRDADEMRAALLDPSAIGSRPTVEVKVPPRPSEHAARRPATPPAVAPSASRTSAQAQRPAWLIPTAGLALVALLGAAAYLLWVREPREPSSSASTAAEPSAASGAALVPAPAVAPAESGAAAADAVPPATRSAAEVAAARAEAEAVRAELNAPEPWSRGLELQAAGDATRNDEAFEAFTRARADAQLALDEAARSRASAEGARSARCGAGASGGPLCQSGDAALAQGALALQGLDARAAASAFSAAQRDFDSAVAPLALRVEPAGPIELEAGAEQTFVARTEPAGATVVFTVQAPGGARPEGVLTADNRYRFRRSAPGNYRLMARATDAQNRESAPVVIAVTVRSSARPANRRPELALSLSGTVESRVGAPFELRATASDPDGATPSVRFTVDKPKEAPAVPSALRASGGAQVLRFTPTVPGQYTFQFWATDAQGERSESRTLKLLVTEERKPTAAPKPASELEAFLVDYAAAWEERDLDRLQAFWQIPTAEIGRIDRAISASEAITAEVELMEGEVMPSGKAARIVFRERITAFGSSRSTEIQAGVYAATLMKDAEGWRIRFRQKR